MRDLIPRAAARVLLQSDKTNEQKLATLDKLLSADYDFMADWQPMSDGTPAPGQYFITWEGKFGNISGRWIEVAEYLDDDTWNVDHIAIRGITDIKVIAWMDLPDKWEGD